MHEIIFYEDKNGNSPVYEFIKSLKSKKGKDARINSEKVNDYIQSLAEYGTFIGEPICKHLDEGIWELRPLRNRILFASLVDGKFILLHQFVKKTQKTPRREIEKAKKELEDYLKRSKNDE